MSLTKVICTDWCLGAWDARWPGEIRRINTDEVFWTETAPDNLPRYLKVVEGEDDEDPEFSMPEPKPGQHNLGNAAGHDYRIAKALNQLDPDDDAHWTDAGLPNVRAVNSLLRGQDQVTRAQVHNCMPGFSRPA